MGDAWILSMNNSFQESEFLSEITFTCINHARFIEAPQGWKGFDQADEEPEGFFHGHYVQ